MAWIIASVVITVSQCDHYEHFVFINRCQTGLPSKVDSLKVRIWSNGNTLSSQTLLPCMLRAQFINTQSCGQLYDCWQLDNGAGVAWRRMADTPGWVSALNPENPTFPVSKISRLTYNYCVTTSLTMAIAHSCSMWPSVFRPIHKW